MNNESFIAIGREFLASSSLLNYTVLFVSNRVWIGIISVLIIGIIGSRFLGRMTNRSLSKVMDMIPGFDRSEYDKAQMYKPLSILYIGWIWTAGLAWIGLPDAGLAKFSVASELLSFLSFIWVGWKIIDLCVSFVERKGVLFNLKYDALIFPIISRTLKVIIVCIGILSTAEILNLPISSLIAGLGIGGMAVALAGQSTISNLFGSITILVDRPFKIGDWVVIGAVEGNVEKLGFRSTRIRTFYNSLVTVPNANLITASVDNYGERQFRRFKTHISILYETPASKIDSFCEGIRNILLAHPKLRKDYFIVNLNKFNDSSLDILLYCFFIASSYSDETQIRHDVMLSIIKLAEELGVGFAYPTRTLYMSPQPMSPRDDDSDIIAC